MALIERSSSGQKNKLKAEAGNGLFDEKNRLLLAALQAEPRISISALARRVGMSAPAVTERLDRLERAGVILGHRLELDPAALGLPLAAFARIKPAAGQLTKLADLAAATPEVSECYRITGEDCFLLKVHAASVEHLAEVLDRFQTYGQSVTSVVVSTPVPRRALPLPGESDAS